MVRSSGALGQARVQGHMAPTPPLRLVFYNRSVSIFCFPKIRKFITTKKRKFH